MYQWCEFKSRRGKNNNLTAQKSNSNTVWFNFQTYIYVPVEQIYVIGNAYQYSISFVYIFDVLMRVWDQKVLLVLNGVYDLENRIVFVLSNINYLSRFFIGNIDGYFRYFICYVCMCVLLLIIVFYEIVKKISDLEFFSLKMFTL